MSSNINDRIKVVLGLDFDGVLNSKRHFDFRCSEKGKQRRSLIIDEFGDTRFARNLIILDENKLKLIQSLVLDSRCALLITSTHRENADGDYFYRLFEASGAPLPLGSIVGCTPVLDHVEDRKRGIEIETWRQMNKFDGKIIIVDDDGDSLFLPEQIRVKIDNECGITAKDIEAIKAIINQ